MSVATMNHDEEARLFAYTDPAIKLFGRDIPLAASIAHEASEDAFSVPDEQFSDKDTKPEMAELEERLKPMDVCSDELESSGCLNDGDDAMDGSDAANELVVGDDAQIVPGGSSICVNIKGSEDSHCLLAVASHEKMPKKPEKLIPCPRCHSLDTKFCYFNNYNVNQPRHFCRKCQRYWTAGGSLRNVPVGAGRRKHKHSISHQKHLLVSDTMPVRTSFMDGANQRSSVSFSTGGSALSSISKPTVCVSSLDTHAALRMENLSSNSTMLNFGQESPLCRSMAATTLSMRECAGLNSNSYASGDANIIAANEKQFPEVVRGFSCNMASNSTAGCYDAALTNASKMVMPSSSCTTSNSPPDLLVGAMGSSSENELKVNSCNKGQGMQLSEAGYGNCGADWQQQPSGSIVSNTPFNPATAYTGLNGAPLRSPPTNMLPSCSGASGSCWAGFPWPLMNPAMWGPPTSEWVGPWTLPFCPSAATATAAAAAAAAATLFQYPASATCTLEKSEGSQPEKCLWVPKTLRIDDPLDAARSSIWAALGLGDGPSSSPINGSSVRMFQVKSKFKDYTETSKSQQHTNPAASSRSAAFHENS